MDMDMDTNFENDCLLPSQYYDTINRKKDLNPIQRLFLAILQDALECYQNGIMGGNNSSTYKKRLGREATRWIFFEEIKYPFSFISTCDALNIDAKYLRGGIRKWRNTLRERRAQGLLKEKIRFKSGSREGRIRPPREKRKRKRAEGPKTTGQEKAGNAEIVSPNSAQLTSFASQKY